MLSFSRFYRLLCDYDQGISIRLAGRAVLEDYVDANGLATELGLVTDYMFAVDRV